MMEQLISRFRELRLEPTGEFEISGFQSADNAIATYISRMFDGASINTETLENAAFVRFIESPPADRVVFGKFDDVAEFLRALRKADSWKNTPNKPVMNKQALPVINVSRSFDTAFMPIEQKRDLKHSYGFNIVEDKDGQPYAAIDSTNASLTYTITLLAAEKETLSLLINTIGVQLRFSEHRSLSAPVKLALVELDLDVTLTDSRDLSFTDISAPIGDDRIFAVQTTLTASVDVIRALAVVPHRALTNVIAAVKEN
jgi:hypothetical protein